MSDERTILLAGNGPSVHGFHWPTDTPIMAVSGGIHAVPEAHHFVSLDRPVCFPQWVTASDRFTKHVALNDFAESWARYAGVRTWPYVDGAVPDFTGDGPLVTGPLPRNDSLLFGVQVAARLGFTRLEFIGCDLVDHERWAISGVLNSWHLAAREAGIEWVNLSPISSLRAWMPTLEGVLA